MARDQYLTVKGVADRPKVSEATVCGRITARELRAIEFGKRWRIADIDLEVLPSTYARRARPVTTQAGGFEADSETRPERGA